MITSKAVAHNKRMQSDLAYGQAADAGRQVLRSPR